MFIEEKRLPLSYNSIKALSLEKEAIQVLLHVVNIHAPGPLVLKYRYSHAYAAKATKARGMPQVWCRRQFSLAKDELSLSPSSLTSDSPAEGDFWGWNNSFTKLN